MTDHGGDGLAQAARPADAGERLSLPGRAATARRGARSGAAPRRPAVAQRNHHLPRARADARLRASARRRAARCADLVERHRRDRARGRADLHDGRGEPDARDQRAAPGGARSPGPCHAARRGPRLGPRPARCDRADAAALFGLGHRDRGRPCLRRVLVFQRRRRGRDRRRGRQRHDRAGDADLSAAPPPQPAFRHGTLRLRHRGALLPDRGGIGAPDGARHRRSGGLLLLRAVPDPWLPARRLAARHDPA